MTPQKPERTTVARAVDMKAITHEIEGRDGPVRMRDYKPSTVDPRARPLLWIHGGGLSSGGLQSKYPKVLTIANRLELDQLLDAAVEAAIEVAAEQPTAGILVTRHNHRTFSLSIDKEVPYGTILERDLLSSTYKPAGV